MLEIKNITKTYETSGFKQIALDNISVNFRSSEFASILGPSGSGKTTFLNIIGGLDKYTKGDLIINEQSTKKFKDKDWDSYRNHKIGFVFQSYNLIPHQTILSNVKLALTLSGITKKEATKRAYEALKEVGLEKHINKKPSELSGGQMQRVAIARALVNDPEILLADEPTGALDSDTSVQIMKILKKISKTKLVIMVTHNPELAKEYSTRIINIKDGHIISDTNPYDGKEIIKETEINNKTNMSFKTALSLSFNNLMTKKKRTILVSLAGSIGIIGIALIMAVSNGFQKYVDSIEEEALTSYPLTIMNEESDITGMLLSMYTEEKETKNTNKIKEKQYISSMMSNVTTNDLKSFKSYIENNYNEINNNLTNIVYGYSISPNIYTIDTTKEVVKLNPSNLFSSLMGTSNLVSSFSSFSSVYNEITLNKEKIESEYDILSGKWPEAYNELVLVLPDKNSIPDLIVYSLGLRDNKELTKMVTSIMNGEAVNINNESLEFTLDDLLNINLKLVMPYETYKYNKKYDVYEDMSSDKDYMENLYNKSEDLKIVGIATAKENSTSLTTGIYYTSDLTKYIIDKASKSEIVQKQLKNSDIDIFSGNKFDKNTNDYDFEFSDLVKVDEKKLTSAFGMKISKEDIEKITKDYLNDISSSIDINDNAKNIFEENLNIFTVDLFSSSFNKNEIDIIVQSYLDNSNVTNKLKEIENNYLIPSETLKNTYKGILTSLLSTYASSYITIYSPVDDIILIEDTLKNNVIQNFMSSSAISNIIKEITTLMQEAKMKKEVLTKVGNLTSVITNKLASSMNVDKDEIIGAFTLNFSEDELARVVSAMMSNEKTTQKSNLINLGYQDIDNPTYISFYFSSFEGKENLSKFIENYNNNVEEAKQINYTDTAGILISSVKTIVSAVSYVLIAFVSISLIVSSIMIGVITYISVFERKKEIGILRAIGASKRNVSSIFNAETFIIGLLSGSFGIIITYLLIPIINIILAHYTNGVNISAFLPILKGIILIILSVVLTLIGGIIPSHSASKKDPVESLRSE